MHISSDVLTLKTGRCELDYIAFGTGKTPLVILNGVSLRTLAVSAPVMRAGYARFGESHRVYMIDRRKNIQPGLSVDDMALDTAAALDCIGVKNADVLGFSQGGMIAQRIAVLRPELVGRLCLVSTLARQNETSRKTLAAWSALVQSGDVRALNREVFRSVYSDAYLQRYRRAFQMLEGEGTAEEVRRFGVLVEACREFDAYDALDAIDCPVLAIGSLHDRTLSPCGMTELAEKLGCELYMYDDYGHALNDEAPDFKQRVANFFTAAPQLQRRGI